VFITRVLAISAFALVLATGVLAQTASDSSAPRGTFEGVKQEHPEWFTSRRPYRPCPASVHLATGGPRASAAPRGARGTFEELPRDETPSPRDT
jgi:hypothetical protein